MAGVTTALFMRTVAWSNQFLDREIVVLREIMLHTTFESTGPEVWSVVSCGMVAIPGMIGCLECPLTTLVFAQSWS